MNYCHLSCSCINVTVDIMPSSIYVGLLTRELDLSLGMGKRHTNITFLRTIDKRLFEKMIIPLDYSTKYVQLNKHLTNNLGFV